MCYAVFIGTDNEVATGEFVPDVTDLYFEKRAEVDVTDIVRKFSKNNVYYVGSGMKCSCGLQFASEYFSDPDEEGSKRSASKFLEFLKEATLTEDIEYYCCWEGNWSSPVEHTREIDILEISLDKNYFGLVENEFIRFRKQQ